MAAMAVASPVMPVFCPLTRVQPVFVADVARAVAAALVDPAAAGRTSTNSGGPSIYTLRELTELTLAVIGRPRPIIDLGGPAAAGGTIRIGGDVLAFLHGPLPMLLKPPITSDQIAILQHRQRRR